MKPSGEEEEMKNYICVKNDVRGRERELECVYSITYFVC